MTRPLIDPRMLSKLDAFYPSLCTIQEATESQNDYGEPVLSWADFSGHVDLPCRVAPMVISSPTGMKEIRWPDMTVVTATHHIALQGSYTSIKSSMRVVVGGTAYNILGVEHDGQGMTTRLRVEEVTL